MTFKVTVTVNHEKEMPKKEMKEIASSVIGKNSCCGAGLFGGYDAKIQKIVFSRPTK